LAVEAAQILEGEGRRVRVVSMPSWELFAAQPDAYRETVLPRAITARVAVEAARAMGWERWVGERGAVVGLDRFGASGPYEAVYAGLGITAAAVAAAVRGQVDARA
jgi:transketolase